ncbi:MAG: peptide chain release factor 2 [Actinomycetota bacterium]|nr:MAG: peptide chain release factor 2 [Actinomycetota bacterium]
MLLPRSIFDFENKVKKLKDLNIEINDKDFWNNPQRAQKVSIEASTIEKLISSLENLETNLSDIKELIEITGEDNLNENDFLEEINNFEEMIEEIENEALYFGEYDDLNAVITINAGAGGVDAHDWAEMLFRMYTRFLSSQDMKYQIEEISQGEEAGIKSASIRVDSYRAYATLESERGVHRLVRISPFDSNKRRHTSFAGVDVVPLIEHNEEIIIQDDEIRVDVYRSSGAGGQHVNTTDSAVRITHIETGIVVACQAERSQLQNKNRALELLKTKLILKQKEEELLKINNIRGDQHEAGWGRQIRSYVLQPYQQVKDARSNTEVGNVLNVLDGDISIFIKEYLKWRRQGIND